MESRPLAVLDIDGVLADDRHRSHHAQEKRWGQYFHPENVANDTVWEEGRILVRSLLEAGFDFVYLTGRSDDLRDVTWRWLVLNGFPEGLLLMRPPYAQTKGTKRPVLAEFKRDILADLIQSRTVVLYDDDPEVIRVAREAFGHEIAVHCTWHVKDAALVRRAEA